MATRALSTDGEAGDRDAQRHYSPFLSLLFAYVFVSGQVARGSKNPRREASRLFLTVMANAAIEPSGK